MIKKYPYYYFVVFLRCHKSKKTTRNIQLSLFSLLFIELEINQKQKLRCKRGELECK